MISLVNRWVLTEKSTSSISSHLSDSSNIFLLKYLLWEELNHHPDIEINYFHNIINMDCIFENKYSFCMAVPV